MSGERIVNINAGPDRFAIAVALMHGDYRMQIPATFEVVEVNTGSPRDHKWIEIIKINSVEREDGSGYRFNIIGHNYAKNCKVKIFYDLHIRKGTMTFLKS